MLYYFEVEGGHPLEGRLKVLAAKNVVLPMMAASILSDTGATVLNNVPDIADIRTMIKVIEQLGAAIEFDADSGRLSLDAKNITSQEAPYDLVRKMRASFLVMGPLLARFGLARVSQPGGCAIGARPVDQHLKGLAKLGAKIGEEHGYTVARAKKLHGGEIYFDRPSHTGTENVMMAAALADGTTTIFNAAQDPEVADFAKFLNKMGADISGAGTSNIVINGVNSLNAVEHIPIGDRLEAGTYLFAALSAGGEIVVEGIDPDNLTSTIFKLEEMGAKVHRGNNSIGITAPERTRPVEIITDPFPGFPTDLQPQIMAVLSRAAGTSVIWERIFENRFIHVMELQRLGANISILGDRATIVGVEKLEGAEIMASDIRGGAGLVLAALAAKGNTTIQRVYHIDRGYQRFEEKLSRLGAKIVRKSR